MSFEEAVGLGKLFYLLAHIIGARIKLEEVDVIEQVSLSDIVIKTLLVWYGEIILEHVNYLVRSQKTEVNVGGIDYELEIEFDLEGVEAFNVTSIFEFLL